MVYYVFDIFETYIFDEKYECINFLIYSVIIKSQYIKKLFLLNRKIIFFK